MPPVGLARGFCVVISNPDETRIGKFYIDTTGERCVGTVGDLSPLWPAAENDGRQIKLLDSLRGRMCYTRVGGTAVTVDFE